MTALDRVESASASAIAFACKHAAYVVECADSACSPGAFARMQRSLQPGSALRAAWRDGGDLRRVDDALALLRTHSRLCDAGVIASAYDADASARETMAREWLAPPIAAEIEEGEEWFCTSLGIAQGTPRAEALEAITLRLLQVMAGVITQRIAACAVLCTVTW